PVFVAMAIPLVAALALLTGRPVIRGNRTKGNPVAAPAVWGYLIAISSMLALAAASGRWAALAGAALFYLSDAMIARDRFVKPLPRARLPIIVTYHLGQGLLVLSLV
ncbi:MAG: lysoplasmalogenase, partial [Candidatus Dormibacteraeota bacterium]|nr:lysoplasmalogenase [Candidatus Dormibacteraeota bacterium]